MQENFFSRISYHAVYENSILEALEFARVNSFTGIQIAVETPHLSFERLSGNAIEEVEEYAKVNDISISIHCPDESVSLFESSIYLREGMFKYFEALFGFAEHIGAKLITIHTGSMAAYPTDTIPAKIVPEIDYSLYEKAFKYNLDKILSLADDRFFICVENYKMESPILELLQLYLNSEQIYLCWDLAKTYTKTLEKIQSIEDYFIKNINRVRQVHLHDINTRGKSHRIIGTGIIDFKRYISLLDNVDVLDYCIEVRPAEAARASLNNLRRLYHD